MQQSPDIDSVFLNAGVQRPYDLADTAEFDIGAFHDEVKVNFSSFVALCHAFLPYLQRPEPTSFIL
jgi:short-subunit dehydrogenase involved in D-alanine esterification of teichoic acids